MHYMNFPAKLQIKIEIAIILRQESPGKRANSCRGNGSDWELVEADAGYVGGFDGVGGVVVLFREGDGEIVDAMFYAELLKEDNEVSDVLDEVVISFVSLDVTQEDYVVGKIEHTISMGQNDNCC